MALQINLTLKEIYRELCPQCKAKLEKMAKEKIADELVKRALEGEEDAKDSH
jgi:uncharacterized protein with PIN domain